MNTQESFWIFTHLGLGDAIVCNALFRHYAELHKDKYVILPQWTHNIAAVQWMLSDVPNIFFYPIETERQLLTCKDSISEFERLELGFYSHRTAFNPVLWDFEFYRQAGLDPELKWKGFKLPDLSLIHRTIPLVLRHHDVPRGFVIHDFKMNRNEEYDLYDLNGKDPLGYSCAAIHVATEIHCIDSSMLNLADLMETPYCKRFVFHRYARKGLPPQLRKPWEIID